MGPAVAVQEPWREVGGIWVFVWELVRVGAARKARKNASAIAAGFMATSVTRELVVRGNFIPSLFGGEARADGLLEFVSAFGVVGIIANEHFAGEFFFRRDGADGGLEPGGKFFRGGGVRVREHDAEESGSEQIHGIGRAQIAADGAGDFSDERGGFFCIGDIGSDAYFHGQKRKSAFHRGGAAIFHGQAILKMIEIGDGVEQIGIGLVAEIDIALELGDELLLDAAEGALTIEQVGRDEKRKHAETEKGKTHRPLGGFFGVHKDQRVHQQCDAARENEHDDCGEDG